MGGIIATKVRTTLQVLLIGISVVIFLVVSSLSDASTVQLDRAVTSTVGAPGTYAIDLPSELGVESQAAANEIAQRIRRLMPSARLGLVQRVDGVTTGCPGEADEGSVTIVALGGDAMPALGPPKTGMFCLSAAVMPAGSLYSAPEALRGFWGEGAVAVDPWVLRQLALGSSDAQRSVTVAVVTGSAHDQTPDIAGVADEVVAVAATTQGLGKTLRANVSRVGGDERLQRASDGIKAVYSLIGWGVLLLAGLGILVSQMIVLKGRSWFYGLARAFGAYPRDVLAMVVSEVAVLLVGGAGLAAILVSIFNESIVAFGRQTLEVDLSLTSGADVPELALGLVSILLVGAGYPAWSASRIDPLEVLEGQTN